MDEADENTAEDNSIVIYPNPSNEYFNIKADDESEFQVEIFDLAGRLISTKNIGKRLDTESLANGTYIAKFRELKTEKVTLKKLIVIKW
ncbi:T9SS type A sorting domain-containing protein [Muricauda sp. JGD-17]|uniref:T9SS type A sorting domain-containing protein n=1 Tax=Flagellimonas ochracea TaxID=2696472 RepID=A0A964WY58_9FLAO|nr:T9SS type A sorting domain-containing protein [Allomuricauda ochracea]NAY92876.1 T9SS type A sorting domain-containing protein [Allomuricauda ochracea]